MENRCRGERQGLRMWKLGIKKDKRISWGMRGRGLKGHNVRRRRKMEGKEGKSSSKLGEEGR